MCKTRFDTILCDSFIGLVNEILYSNSGRIAQHEPFIIGNEEKYLLDALSSREISSSGKYLNRLEKLMKVTYNVLHAIVMVNGTAALHIGLKLLGVKPGHLVITQPFSYVATCNAINYLGAQPFFVDIDRKTVGMSPDKLQHVLSKHTVLRSDGCFHIKSGKRISACLPVHTLGHPVRIDEIVDICKQNQITVIEDAAEAIGSLYKGRMTGTFGKAAILSLNGNKTITSGAGGVLITNDYTIASQARYLASQAKIKHTFESTHDAVGYNYQMSNLNAAIACAQIEKLTEILRLKRDLASVYRRFFEKTEWSFLDEPSESKSNFWLNAILLSSKKQQQEFLKATNRKGINTRAGWQLLNTLPMYRQAPSGNLDNAIDLQGKLVTLPSGLLNL